MASAIRSLAALDRRAEEKRRDPAAAAAQAGREHPLRSDARALGDAALSAKLEAVLAGRPSTARGSWR